MAGVTLAVTVLVPLRFSGALRLWAPALGIVAGSLVAGLGFGIYDMSTVYEARWIGLPDLAYPGLDLSFRPEFWALLPSFLMVTLVSAMDTLGDAIAIQRVSWRRPRAIDFRSIQGAIAADGAGNLLSGLAGTVPNTTYGVGIAVAELTGVTSRAIGICVGIVFAAFAFLPKLLALIIAIPGPVVAAYFIVDRGADLRLRHEDPAPGGAGLPQRPRRRRRVLAGHRLPVRLDLPGANRQERGRSSSATA